MSDLTEILNGTPDGGLKTGTDLLPLVYEELRKLAAAKMAQQPPGHTLQATALVHEAYLRLTGGTREEWKDRAHFFRAAAQAMRCVLIENARKKSRWKRGERLERVALEELDLAENTPPDTLLIVHEALERLAAEDATRAELVRLRFFVGLSYPEAAKVMGLSEPTVKRYWDFARAWLLREIRVIAAGG